MDMNENQPPASNAFFGCVFGLHLLRRSLGEGGFVVKMNIFVS